MLNLLVMYNSGKNIFTCKGTYNVLYAENESLNDRTSFYQSDLP